MCKDSSAVQTFLQTHPQPRIRRLAKKVDSVVEAMSNSTDASDISDDER
jgi:hypothetical protein